MNVYDRVPVQGHFRPDLPEYPPKPAGTVEAWEHVAAWHAYAERYGRGQSAERIVERAGFSYYELVEFLGRPPRTWRERDKAK